MRESGVVGVIRYVKCALAEAISALSKETAS